jgi:hypothetical protein
MRFGEVLSNILTTALKEYFPDEVAPLVAGDIIDFLNEKYIDKNINEEWGKIDVEARIKYHEKMIEILKTGKARFNNHGLIARK